LNDSQKAKDSDSRGERPAGRRLAEWFTLGISTLLVVAVAGILAYEAMRGDSPFVPISVEVMKDEAVKVGQQYVVPVQVQNRGAKTVRDLTLRVKQNGGREQDGHELRIDYLGEGAEQRVYVYLQSDPREEKLEVRAVAYQVD
jgi:uncharacterized protein (TIGR02588 family)